MSGRAFRYILPYRRSLALVLVISLLSTGLSLWLPYLTKAFVDEAMLARDMGALRRIVLLFIAAGALGFVFNIVSGLRYTQVSARILFDMRRDVYEHLQRLSPRFYASTRLGDIVSRINSDIGEIQRVVAEVALAWVGNVLFLAGSIGILVWLDWRLFLVGMATLPASAWALVRYRRQMERRVDDLRRRSADIGSFLIETLQGMRTVVTSNAQQREVGRFTRLNDAFIATLMGLQRVHYLAGGLPGLLISAGVAAVFLYGGYRVVAGTMTLGTLAAFMAYQARIVGPVQALMGLYSALATARVSWRRVAELLDTPPEIVERPGALPLPSVRGRVELDDVTLSYGRGGPVLDGVSFIVEPGEAVAIVGASGSGKSTIGDLLLRLLDPDAGVVRLDGHDLRAVRLADLRRHVQIVEQDPVLFHASIADNVRYVNPEAGDAEVDAALEAAGISRFVASLPERVHTIVGDRGLALSAGERQRIALARAFLANPSVLILDEPTAALDPVSEQQVIDGYRRVMRGRTTLAISHRLDLVRSVDRVVVLDAARVIETGPPSLLESGVGAFAALFRTTGQGALPS
ncbi:MAG TPA: ABC transporter ATP-binding protein [Vicinamibacterales bacterium]|nr:ABC transporter ATP-binding protein [Vicinamibacterales bacterium]